MQTFSIASLYQWLKIFGIVFIVGGIAALAVPAVAGITIELLLRWLLLRPVEGVQALASLFLIEAMMKMVFSWQWRRESNIGWILASGIRTKLRPLREAL